jgi:hypothetical protein
LLKTYPARIDDYRSALKMPWSAGILPAFGASRQQGADMPKSGTSALRAHFHGFRVPVSRRA